MTTETKLTIGMCSLVGIMILLLALLVYVEIKCPCLQYGEERIQVIYNTGSSGLGVPIYGRDCIKRDKCH